MPQSDYSFLKLPRNLVDLQILRDNLEIYTSDYTIQVLVGYCLVYVFMQTFMIPGTVFMSLLAGALSLVLSKEWLLLSLLQQLVLPVAISSLSSLVDLYSSRFGLISSYSSKIRLREGKIGC